MTGMPPSLECPVSPSLKAQRVPLPCSTPGAAAAAAASGSSGLGALLSLLAGMCGTVLGTWLGGLGGDGLLTCQKFTASPSPHALSNTVCCESTHFLQTKWKPKSLTKKCVRGENSGNAVSTDGKYSRIGFYFLSTIFHIFNLLRLSAEPGFVLKVFSCVVHSFTTDAACLFSSVFIDLTWKSPWTERALPLLGVQSIKRYKYNHTNTRTKQDFVGVTVTGSHGYWIQIVHKKARCSWI